MDSLSEYFQSYLTALQSYDVVGAFWVNIQLAFWAALGSAVLGTVLALMRISPAVSYTHLTLPTICSV